MYQIPGHGQCKKNIAKCNFLGHSLLKIKPKSDVSSIIWPHCWKYALKECTGRMHNRFASAVPQGSTSQSQSSW